MSRHAYPAAALYGDYLRAAAGFLPAAGLLSFEPVGPAGLLIFGGVAALFGAFGLHTLLRHGTRLELTEAELHMQGPWRRTIFWAKLDRLKLSYYSTRRDRRHGWMQLEIGAGSTRVRLDSRIEGFDAVVACAAAAAGRRGLELSPATVDNLRALGIASPQARAGREW